MSVLQPYQQRVVQERDELQEKVGKLAEFVRSPGFADVATNDRTLLLEQYQAMTEYVIILSRRIARF